MYRGVAPAVIALSLVSALLFGGLVHAVIPHTHGVPDDHSGSSQTESPVWASLHGALAHEDKKGVAMLLHFLLFATLASLTISFAVVQLVAPLSPSFEYMSCSLDPLRGLFLRRGIAQYRAFG